MVDLDRIIGNYVSGIAPVIQFDNGLYGVVEGSLIPYNLEDPSQGLWLNYYYHIPGTYSYEYDQETGQWISNVK